MHIENFNFLVTDLEGNVTFDSINGDQYDFGALIGPRFNYRNPAEPWLLPDGRCVLDRRPLPFLKRTFLHMAIMRITGSGLLRSWM